MCVAMGMASVAPMIVNLSSTVGGSVDALVRVSNLHPDVLNVARALRETALSNATIGKGFNLAFSVVQMLAVGAAFTYKYSSSAVKTQSYVKFDVLHPLSLAFLLVGVGFPHVTMGSITRTVTATASAMVEDAMGVFRSREEIDESKITDEEREKCGGESYSTAIDSFMEGPEVARGVVTATTASLRHLMAPALLNITTPLLIAIFCGIHSLFGFLLGSLLSSFSLAMPLDLTGHCLELVSFFAPMDIGVSD